MAKLTPLNNDSKLDAADSGSLTSRRDPAIGWQRYLLWVIVPLVFAAIGWSIWGDQLVAVRTQQFGEIAAMTAIGVVGLLLAFYTRHSNMRVERAYSAHLEGLSQRLRSLAYQDALTELYNHRYFYEQLTHEVERATRYARPVSVILMDLDHFKEVNDTYGHLMGDKLLSLVGKVIGEQVRGADIAARYGGDEFAIILPDTPLQAAQAAADKLAFAIVAGQTSTGQGEGISISGSFGVASCPDEARTVSDLLQLADDRVYESKKNRSNSEAELPELMRAASHS
jgi:diguanylate cyclase (GGDEF)-like protein